MSFRLLNGVTFFNERMVDALLQAAVQAGINVAYDPRIPETDRESEFIQNSVFVMPEGENPHPTDSGNLFTRKLRDHLGIREDSIMSPQLALSNLSAFRRVIFVDDFVGSGNQFIETWRRPYEARGLRTSFAQEARRVSVQFLYCPCICTDYGFTRIAKHAPNVTLLPAHVLQPDDNAASASSRVWQGIDGAEAIRHLRNASARAGYTSTDGSPNDWRGFHSLGLLLGFAHGVPDASLPLLYSRKNNWIPLLNRRQDDD